MKKVTLSIFTLLLLIGQFTNAQNLKGTLWDGSFQGSALSIHFSTNDTVYINGGAIATYEVSADTMRILDLAGSTCGSTIGVYLYTIMGNALDLINSNDPCADRALVLANVVWTLSPQSNISELGLGLEIYPNPFKESIKIQFSSINKDARYFLTDLSGVVQRVGIISDLHSAIETSDLASGMYIFQIPEYNFSHQLIKK